MPSLTVYVTGDDVAQLDELVAEWDSIDNHSQAIQECIRAFDGDNDE
jgi:hypothetical protein